MRAVCLGRPATDAERRAGLEGLARDWDSYGPERQQLLEGWAHPGLTRELREERFREYQFVLRLAAAIRGGDERWQECAPDLTWACQEERQEVAAGRYGKDAEKLLHALMNGDGEK
jgi:hypothetical protein